MRPRQKLMSFAGLAVAPATLRDGELVAEEHAAATRSVAAARPPRDSKLERGRMGCLLFVGVSPWTRKARRVLTTIKRRLRLDRPREVASCAPVGLTDGAPFPRE